MLDTNPFVTRVGRAAQAIAEDLGGLEVGDRLPTMAEYAAKHKVGFGTVQKALEVLQDQGCIDLEARGQLGTFLQGIDRARLWAIRGQQALVGVMPLPYSRRYEGLATGLRAAWQSEHISLLLAFMRGAETRLDALVSGRYDFVVMSRFAAEFAADRGWNIKIALDFGPETYGQEHVLLFAPGRGPSIQPGYRVGIDNSSFDQCELVQFEIAGIEVETVEMGYMQLMEALVSDQIQVTVWDADPLALAQSSPNVTRVPLRSKASQAIVPKDTTTVVVTRAGDSSTARLLEETLSVPAVLHIQQEVLSGQRMPSY